MGKQNVYDHSVRAPLVFSGPGIPEGERRDAFTYHHDLYPTLADLAGLAAPDTVDGESLAPVIAEGADGPRESVFTAYSDTQRAVRTDRHKLIENFPDAERRTQLFDVEADPAETEDVSEDPAYADDLERLRDRLAGWRETVDDPALEG
jgi:arylsulfatase A-like enzyme